MIATETVIPSLQGETVNSPFQQWIVCSTYFTREMAGFEWELCSSLNPSCKRGLSAVRTVNCPTEDVLVPVVFVVVDVPLSVVQCQLSQLRFSREQERTSTSQTDAPCGRSSA